MKQFDVAAANDMYILRYFSLLRVCSIILLI